jgi:hypothetical protein
MLWSHVDDQELVSGPVVGTRRRDDLVPVLAADVVHTALVVVGRPGVVRIPLAAVLAAASRGAVSLRVSRSGHS